MSSVFRACRPEDGDRPVSIDRKPRCPAILEDGNSVLIRLNPVGIIAPSTTLHLLNRLNSLIFQKFCPVEPGNRLDPLLKVIG